MLHHKANLNGYLAYHTGQSLEKINQDTDRDFFMSAKEAKEYGLIDGVILNPLKALQPLAAAWDLQQWYAVKLHFSDGVILKMRLESSCFALIRLIASFL